MNSILIVAGENSGEKYGADVVREFSKKHPSFSFFGVGGKRMQAEGVELIFPIEELSAVGIFEVIRRLPHFQKIFRRLEKDIDARRPAAALLIDSPDFNLRLAKRLKKMKIPVLYYISPTVWAWRSGRLKVIKETVTRMLLIFPFEKAIYATQNIPAVYVGHPLRHSLTIRLGREEFFLRHSLPSEARLITLLPGSRRTEVKNHLPVLLKVTKRMKSPGPLAFVLVMAENLASDASRALKALEQEGVKIITEDGYEAMAYADLVLSACGTANLETALLGTPFLAFYRLSPLTYYPFRRFVKIRDYSIVNILAGKRIVPELIQRRFTAKNIIREAQKLLSDETGRACLKAEFKRIKDMLGEDKAAANAARELGKLVAG